MDAAIIANRAARRAGHSYSNVRAKGSSFIHQGDVHNENHYQIVDPVPECHQTFKTSSYETFKDRNPRRIEGTCKWLLDHPQYLDWKHGNHDPVLWISADPGCGKSVLAKALVDIDLRSSDDQTVCYFFFKDNEEQDSLATAFCAILHQLFSQQQALISHAMIPWRQNKYGLRHEVHELWRILQNSAADEHARPIICVIDALDECHVNDRQLLLELLSDLCNTTGVKSRIKTPKFLVTSRPYDYIQRSFRDVISRSPSIHLRGEEQNESIHQEINLVIEKMVGDVSEEFSLSESYRQQLQNQLLEMKNRTYLWLYLAIEEIRDVLQNSLYPESVEIPSLPVSVEDAYERLLNKISPKNKIMAQKVLLIIVGSRQPLTIQGMCLALGSAHAYENNLDKLNIPNSKHIETQIRNWCGLFVFIQDTKLFLIHQTAKDFLLSPDSSQETIPQSWGSSLLPTHVEAQMAAICTTHLCLFENAADLLGAYINDEPEMGVAMEDVLRPEAFTTYCGLSWNTHLHNEAMISSKKLTSQVIKLLDINTDIGRNSWALNKPKLFEDEEDILPQHIAAFYGYHSALAQLQKDENFNLEAQTSSGRSMLAWAVKGGHSETTRWLLSIGAKTNLETLSTSKQPLIQACKSGKLEMVRLLLAADSESKTVEANKALAYMSYGSDPEIIKLLLKAGANANSRRQGHFSPLCAAAKDGATQLVQALLEAGADVNISSMLDDNQDVTPLIVAVEHGNAELVKVFIAAGADVNRMESDDYNPLFAAVRHEKLEIAMLLLEAGAQKNPSFGTRKSLMARAARNRSLEMVKLLIDAGVDVNDRGKHGVQYISHFLDFPEGNPSHDPRESALMLAVRYNDLEIAEELVAAGADINATGGSQCTVLGAAVASGFLAMVLFALRAGADINLRCCSGSTTALMLAARYANIEIVDALLGHGADVEALTYGRTSALKEAVIAESTGVAERLIEVGADANTTDDKNLSPIDFVTRQLEYYTKMLHTLQGLKDTDEAPGADGADTRHAISHYSDDRQGTNAGYELVRYNKRKMW